jgi:hypothetical protein
MNTFKKGYYQADIINGVHFIGSVLEDGEQFVTDAKGFAESLKYLSDKETIVAFFDETTEDILNEIDAEYGIREI